MEPRPEAVLLVPVAVALFPDASDSWPVAVELSPAAEAPAPTAVESAPSAVAPFPTAVQLSPVQAQEGPERYNAKRIVKPIYVLFFKIILKSPFY